MIHHQPSKTTAYRSFIVQPRQYSCTPGSADPFATSSLCAFLFGQGAQHTMPQAFGGNVLMKKLSVLEQS